MSIHNFNEISAKLGSAATEQAYTQIPVFTYTEGTLEDFLLPNGCPYLMEEDNYYWSDPTRWTYLDTFVLPIFKEGLMEAFNISAEQSADWFYSNYQQYTDELLCEIYQGDPTRYNFTDEQFAAIEYYNKFVLTRTYSKFGNKLIASRLLAKPIDMIKQKVGYMAGLEDDEETPMKFYLYSIHDTQISNILVHF